jgi:hypothetical protein
MRMRWADPIAEVRLAELIWRTVKLRVSLLALFIASLLVVWLAVASGNPAAQKIDSDFCRQLFIETGTPQGDMLNEERVCASNSALAYIETRRRFDKLIPPETYDDETSTKQLDALKARQSRFTDYDARRREAYRIQLSLPYTASTVPVNALLLADASPFCVLLVVAIVLALGLQQRCYAQNLAVLLHEKNTTGERATISALTQFFAGNLSKLESDKRLYLVYKRPLALFPETMAVSLLLLALTLTSLKLLADYDPTVAHPTESILFSYYSLLFSLSSVLFVFLRRTQALYAGLIAERMGAPVGSALFFGCRKKWHQLAHYLRSSTVFSMRLGRAMVILLVPLGFGCLLLPWVQPWPLAGYQFLLHQRTMATGEPYSIVFYPIAPSLFLEIRFQLMIALLFFLICMLHAVLEPFLTGTVDRILRNVRAGLGFSVALLALNALFYLAVLEYESTTTNPWPMLDLMFPSTGLATLRTFPLLFENPAYGFWIFLCCSVLLMPLALLNTAREATD